VKEILIIGDLKGLDSKIQSFTHTYTKDIFVVGYVEELITRKNTKYVFTLKKEEIEKLKKLKVEKNLNFTIFSIYDNIKGIEKLFRYEGWTSLAECISQSIQMDYKIIYTFKMSNINFEKQMQTLKYRYNNHLNINYLNDSKIIENIKIQESVDSIIENDLIYDEPIMSDISIKYNTTIGNGTEKYFEELIKNKKVIFVGPSPILKGSKLGEWIDSFDIVIRTNNFYSTLEENKEDYGSKCDVLYTNVQFIREMSPLPIQEYVSKGLKFLRSKSYIPQPHTTDYNKFVLTSPINENTINHIQINNIKSPLMGSYILFDILQYNPSEFFIAGVNCYNGNVLDWNNQYLNGYLPQKIIDQATARLTPDDLLNPNKQHDTKSNLELIHKLYNNKLIKIEESTKKALKIKENIKSCIACLVTDDYYEPFRVFIKSLLTNNPWFDKDIVIFDLDLKSTFKTKLKKLYKNIKFHKINKENYNHIDMSVTEPRLIPTYYKIDVFNIKGYNKVIMMDIDMIINGDIKNIFENYNDGIYGVRTYRMNIDKINHDINTGVLIINDEYLSDELYNKLLESYKNGYKLPDQHLINSVLRKQIKDLPKIYNYEKRMYHSKKYSNIRLEDIKIIHYVGLNPWDDIEKKKQTVVCNGLTEADYNEIETIWFKYAEEEKNNDN